MVAYSFNARFVAPIIAGAKRQTIRADRKRHAQPGETLQLYTGMRTKACRLIGRAICARIMHVEISVDHDSVRLDGLQEPADAMDAFAVCDGFASWDDMADFWRAMHGRENFEGIMITWRDFTPGAPPCA